MADVSFFNRYELRDDGIDVYTIVREAPFGPDTVTFLTGSDPPSYGDPVSVLGEGFGTYLGSYQGGMVVELGIGEYVLLTDDTWPDGWFFFADTDPWCLLRGTPVLTPSGERRVEDLRPGDEVVTADGRAVPVRWVGRQSVPWFGTGAVPVTIRAGALADGVPSVDVHVSGDHAVLVDGLLVNARALVNGVSVLPMPDPPRTVEYFHLELDRHEVIVAAGAPVESFVDDVTRQGFDNYDEWVALGLAPLPTEPIGYLKVKSSRQLPTTVRDRLAARAEVLTGESAMRAVAL